ncbi:ExeM/NucH family extracellular endonuclease [Marinobacter sp. CHS3-4]|uniref:ExeM/NucH family extracellular endonuclease n=1 Tax=Marinobacter sp. CHS3-4 TaxID=3045174 RepID=UPI0024B4A910|nr:ExeM/NucH family extracellular endonuclease [Marinobacter sp. CHS3-4]MDI9243701.1 ExeM/NucH family extracellular endonuclease [Marinobacter sp. CHS3-4]
MPYWFLNGLLSGLLLLSGHLYASCDAPALAPSDVQGAGDRSALTGKTVTVEGVITLDSRQPNGWRGFYLQSTSDQSDNDPRTSDALFVYTDRPGGKVGSKIQVTARVKEFHGLTELTRVSRLTICGLAKLPDPILLQLPWPGQAPPEHLENMRVTFTQPLTLIGHYNFTRFGELVLSDQPQVIPTEHTQPGPKAHSMAMEQIMGRVYLDDGRRTQNPSPLPWPAQLLTQGQPVRSGDRLTNLTGVLDYRFGHWRLQPTSQPRLSKPSMRPEAPARSDGSNLRVVSLNLGNFFNGKGSDRSFEQSRGARHSQQFAVQKARLVTMLSRLDADIIAASEMENDHYKRDSAIAELATAMGRQWHYVRTPGSTGQDAIRTDLLYRSDRVQAIGNPQRLTSGHFALRGRPPLAQIFKPLGSATDSSVRIVVPHFKSKACGGATGKNRDQQDGQGCYAHRRTEEAEAVADWLALLPAQPHLAGTLLTGDLNSYSREWPLTTLEDSGLTNIIRDRQTCGADRCPNTTYRYQGRHGSLDHALVSENLKPRVVAAGAWPINAEEFGALGYQGALASPTDTPWRSSDHNPLYIDLAL